MKLSALEERARQEQGAAKLEKDQQRAEERAEDERIAEEFRQEVIPWMVEAGDLDAAELGEVVSVVDHKYRKVRLSVPGHTSIVFQLVLADDGFAVRDGEFSVSQAHGSHRRRCYSLGDALLIASEEWQKREEQKTEGQEWEAERQAKRERQEAEAAERGAEYLALLNEYPILRPILDILGAFLGGREQFYRDLEMADEFAGHVEASYQEKLEQAQHEARRAEGERDDLQRDLWDAQDELRRRNRGR